MPIKIACGQLEVIAGRPDLNTKSAGNQRRKKRCS